MGNRSFIIDMKRILPYILGTLTQHDRSRVVVGVDFQWSNKSWIHNIFRCYELVFWRREGIRFEASTTAIRDYENNRTIEIHEFGTYESLFAHGEEMFRLWIKGRLPKFEWVEIPVLQPVFAGFKLNPQTIYSFAIAFDAVSDAKDNGGVVTTVTVATHTVTGSNTIAVFVGGRNSDTNRTIDSYTQNAVTGTMVSAGVEAGGTVRVRAAVLVAPATGAAVMTISGVTDGSNKQFQFHILTYSGAKQTGQPDSFGELALAASTVTTFTVSTTVVAANCWLVGHATEDAGDIVGGVAGTGTTYRGADSFNQNAADSDAVVSTGSQSLNYGRAGTSGNLAGTTLSIAPVAATVNSGFFNFM